MSRADRAVLLRRLRALVGGPDPRTDERPDDASGDGPGVRGATSSSAVPDGPVLGAQELDALEPPAPGPDPHATVAARGWVPGAVASAAAAYAGAYGGPRAVGGAVVDGTAAQDRPGRPTGRRWRWGMSWRLAVAAVTCIALLGGAVALRAVALAPGPPVALPDASPVAAATGALPGAAPATAGTVIVHVVGAVAVPGVVALPTGSRVIDAVDAAGGASADAALAAINLARPLVDGEQVVVPRAGELPLGAASAATPEGTSTTDLNTADAAALDELPGIGPVLAGRIVERRTEHPFTTVDELGEVDGIGTALVERLRPLVHV